jgi:hypothetical protein
MLNPFRSVTSIALEETSGVFVCRFNSKIHPAQRPIDLPETTHIEPVENGR